MLSRDIPISDICFLINRKERTIWQWKNEFLYSRISSIFTNHANNDNASKLTKDQKAKIKRTLSQPPNEYGLPKDFWDPPSLKEYISAEFGVVYQSKRSYHFLLKFSNLSFKYPDKQNIKRNETIVNKRMIEIKEELKRYLKDPDYEVFASDETRIVLEAFCRKAWLRKGRKTIVKAKQERESQNYLGFLDQRNGSCSVFRLKWQKQEEVIRGIRKLMTKYKGKKICLVWDNAPFHRGKLIREQLKYRGKLQGIHLINMPPYAPDRNPIEHVWKEVKREIANKQFLTLEDTKRRFEYESRSGVFNYQF